VAVFPGKLGLAVKEAVELWKGDLREKSLLVRGTRLREVPLPPFAQEVS
jgi:integrase/recombinase XerD